MADIKVIKYNIGGHKIEHDPASDSVQFSSFKTANYELTDTKLGNLIDGADAADEHIHDARYFRENEHISTSAGAGDAGKPAILDAGGKWDESLLDIPTINGLLDHGLIQGLGDDDHTQYILVDGTRAFTGNQSMGSNRLTNVAAPSVGTDATNKSYVDSVAVGLRAKGNIRVATTANIDVSSAPAAIDGVTLVSGDRVLVKDQTDATENGIYVFNGAASAMTRSEDQDNNTLSEIVNGVWIPIVLEGTANQNKAYLITSVGTGTNGVHQIGVDDIVWSLFSTPTQLNAGDGIDATQFASNIVQLDLLAGGGLKFTGTEVGVEPNDFAGDGLVDDGSDNLAIDWATLFTIDGADAKAIKASDLASTATGKGASIIGLEDPNGVFAAEDMEEAMYELYQLAIQADAATYTAGAGGITKGQLVYISGNDTVLPYSSITNDEYVVGIALEDAAATNPVRVGRFDDLVTGILSGATAGTAYFWNGTTLVTSEPTAAGSNVWMVGVAKNATDLSIEVRHLYKNS